MATPKRIDMSLFEQPLIDLINASAKIFPVNYAFIQANSNPNNYDYVKVTEAGTHKNEIYTWDNGWTLIGADDLNVDWVDVKSKPTSYPPSTHTHTKVDITDFAHNHDTLYSAINHNHDTLYASKTHNHDTQYAALNHNHDTVYAAISHNHDGTYYKKSEVDTALSGKSNTNHTHVELHTHTNKALLDTIASENVHAHANKPVIDQLTQPHIDALNNGLSSGHTHSNLAILNELTYSGVQPTIDLIGIEQANAHRADSSIHVTSADKTNWNSKTSFSGSYTDLTNQPTIPTQTSQLTNNSGFITDVSGKADKTYVDTQLATKADSSTLSGHTGNTTVHVTQADKDTWNGKANVSQIPTNNNQLTNGAGYTGDEITIGATQPTTNLWYKVVG